jgi:hypothetical protein
MLASEMPLLLFCAIVLLLYIINKVLVVCTLVDLPQVVGLSLAEL